MKKILYCASVLIGIVIGLTYKLMDHYGPVKGVFVFYKSVFKAIWFWLKLFCILIFPFVLHGLIIFVAIIILRKLFKIISKILNNIWQNIFWKRI